MDDLPIPLPIPRIPRVPEDQTLAQFIFGAHDIRPWRRRGLPWLVDEQTGMEYSREDLLARAEGLAGSLQSSFALKPKDVVVLFSPNHIDYPICIWATHLSLGIVAPTDPTLTVTELTSHLQHVKASMIVTHSEVLQVAQDAADKVGLAKDRIITMDRVFKSKIPSVDDVLRQGGSGRKEHVLAKGENKEHIAYLMRSGGHPRVVKISHFAAIASVLLQAAHNLVHEDYARYDDKRYRPGDTCLATLPLHDIYGLNAMLHFNIFAGLSLVVPGRLTFKKFLASASQRRITHLMVAPSHVVPLCKDSIVKDHDLSSVRVVLNTTSTLPAELYKQLIALFPNAHIGQVYGSSEVGLATMHAIKDKTTPHSGLLLPGVSGKVVKQDGSPANPGEEGELLIQSMSGASGYLGDEEATRATFLEDGWIRTGEVVKIDQEGNVVSVLDRSEEIIKTKGFTAAELHGKIDEVKSKL